LHQIWESLKKLKGFELLTAKSPKYNLNILKTAGFILGELITQGHIKYSGPECKIVLADSRIFPFYIKGNVQPDKNREHWCCWQVTFLINSSGKPNMLSI
jgi:hypothetical protein